MLFLAYPRSNVRWAWSSLLQNELAQLLGEMVGVDRETFLAKGWCQSAQGFPGLLLADPADPVPLNEPEFVLYREYVHAIDPSSLLEAFHA